MSTWKSCKRWKGQTSSSERELSRKQGQTSFDSIYFAGCLLLLLSALDSWPSLTNSADRGLPPHFHYSCLWLYESSSILLPSISTPHLLAIATVIFVRSAFTSSLSAHLNLLLLRFSPAKLSTRWFELYAAQLTPPRLPSSWVQLSLKSAHSNLSARTAFHLRAR